MTDADTPTLPLSTEEIKPRVILCEGPGDKSFFDHFIGARNLPDFTVIHPRQDIDPGGRGGYASRLRGLRLQPGFDLVDGIVVVSDNNANPAASFSRVRQQLLDAGYPTPNRSFTMAYGSPSVIVITMPCEREPGQLETLCLQAMASAWPHHAQCVETFSECAGVTA